MPSNVPAQEVPGGLTPKKLRAISVFVGISRFADYGKQYKSGPFTAVEEIVPVS
ncbi:MAG: hypothetical protein ACI8Z1_001462 [Candidatus Azotimanducaceae bacterium]|jgi:hypothetical protein